MPRRRSSAQHRRAAATATLRHVYDTGGGDLYLRPSSEERK